MIFAILAVSGGAISTAHAQISQVATDSLDLPNFFTGGYISETGSIISGPQRVTSSGTYYYDVGADFDGSPFAAAFADIAPSSRDALDDALDESLGNGVDTNASTLFRSYNSNQETDSDSSTASNGRSDLWNKFMGWLKDTGQAFSFKFFGGDPGVFSLDGTDACTNKMHLGSHEDNYWRFNLYATEPAIPFPMDRELCKNTHVLVVDWNENGKVDHGHEILFSETLTVFESLEALDMLFGTQDGKLSEEDGEIWDIMFVGTFSDRHTIELTTMAEHGIVAFGYDNVKEYWNDQYGTGVYADTVGISSEHFRINSWNPDGVVMSNGDTHPMFGMIIAPLLDCTIQDIRYHVAEQQTGQFLNVDDPYDPTEDYQRVYEECMNFAEVQSDPDRYQSHWIAGIASMEHKKGIMNGTSDMELLKKSKASYEMALEMSPDNPFYNVDYCILHYHMGMNTRDCMPAIHQAIEDRPDVQWFKDALPIAGKGAY